jgi:hypothetical protein
MWPNVALPELFAGQEIRLSPKDSVPAIVPHFRSTSAQESGNFQSFSAKQPPAPIGQFSTWPEKD